MARRKNWSPEQIIMTLRQIEVQLAQGLSLALAFKEAGISEQSYYRWQGVRGLQLEQAKRLKGLCHAVWCGHDEVCLAQC
jgi:hypothetical protein